MDELIARYESATGQQARKYSYDFRLFYTSDFVEWLVSTLAPSQESATIKGEVTNE